MCKSTAADFDGDEVYLYMIATDKGMRECEMWRDRAVL